MPKTVLCCLSEWGYWGEELVGPCDVLADHGYQVDFMTPTGQKPPALEPSMRAHFRDRPLDKEVTSEHFAQRTREIQESNLLDHPKDLSTWFPQMPYFNDAAFGHGLEDYYTKRDASWQELEKYDAQREPDKLIRAAPGGNTCLVVLHVHSKTTNPLEPVASAF